MDAGYVAMATGLVMLGWFGIKQYVDRSKLESEVERLREKIDELKEFIKQSK